MGGGREKVDDDAAAAADDADDVKGALPLLAWLDTIARTGV